MANTLSTKDTLRLAVLIGFLTAAAIGGCTGTGEMREGEHGGGEEESGATLTLDETYDGVRNGARLIIGYDAEANAFVGTVQNVTDGTLSRVRVEVHLSNGTELGPTTPVDLAPGETVRVTLPATDEPFRHWTAHPESGPGHGAGGEGGGEHDSGGERREGRGEHGAGGEGGGG